MVVAVSDWYSQVVACRELWRSATVVSGGCKDEHSVTIGVFQRSDYFWNLVRQGQAQVDDSGFAVDCVPYGFGDDAPGLVPYVERVGGFVVEAFDGQNLGLVRHAEHTLRRVVCHDAPHDVRAVAVVVGDDVVHAHKVEARVVVDIRVVVVVDVVANNLVCVDQELACQVGVLEVEAVVNHSNDNALALVTRWLQRFKRRRCVQHHLDGFVSVHEPEARLGVVKQIVSRLYAHQTHGHVGHQRAQCCTQTEQHPVSTLQASWARTSAAPTMELCDRLAPRHVFAFQLPRQVCHPALKQAVKGRVVRLGQLPSDKHERSQVNQDV